MDHAVTVAVAGPSVLGDSEVIKVHRCKQGGYFFCGMAGTAILAYGFDQISVSLLLWLIALGLLLGWFFNARERKRIKSETITKHLKSDS